MSEPTTTVDLAASPGRPSTLAARQRADEMSLISEKEKLQNPAYNSSFNRYKKFIDSNRIRLARHLQLPPDKYFSVPALETFFTHVIGEEKNCNPSSARKYALAIYKYGELIENTTLTRDEVYAKNPNIKSVYATLEMALLRKAKAAEKKGLDVQEKTLSTNIASPKYISTCASTALDTDTSVWLQSIPQMTVCYATLMRHCSTNVVTFGRLMIVNKNPDGDSYFPHDTEPFEEKTQPVLSIIFTPLSLFKRKENFTERRTEVTGGFRSMRYEICWISHLAFSVFKKLNDPFATNYHAKQINDSDIENININLMEQNDDDEEDQDEQPNSASSSTRPSARSATNYDPNSFVNRSLRMIKLYPTRRETTARNLDKVMKLAGLEKWEKVTHFKKSGIEYATSNGLTLVDTDALAGTKNNPGEKNYRTQLPAPVMKLLAGVQKGKLYGSGPIRASFPPPAGLSWESDSLYLSKIVWKHYVRLLGESESEDGDKGAAMVQILYRVLPFFTKVILQDGVLWVHEHRQHELSFALLALTFTNGEQTETYEAYSVRMYARLKSETQRDPNIQSSDGNYERLSRTLEEVVDELKLLREEQVLLKEALALLAMGREERDNNPIGAIRTEVSRSCIRVLLICYFYARTD